MNKFSAFDVTAALFLGMLFGWLLTVIYFTNSFYCRTTIEFNKAAVEYYSKSGSGR